MSEGVRFACSARPVICIIDHNLPRLTQLYSPGPARRDNMVPFALSAGWSAADGREEARVAEHSDAMIHPPQFPQDSSDERHCHGYGCGIDRQRSNRDGK
jgi:hypothetical protein